MHPRRNLELLPYVAGRAEFVQPSKAGQSVQRRLARLRRRRPRREVGADEQPHGQRHGEPGLRPGRGRSGGREPDRVRDVLRREAAVLPRGLADLQQLRPRRRQRLLGLQQLGAADLLLAAHRPRAAARRVGRLRGRADGDDHPRRREAHGQDVGTVEPRVAAGDHRRGDGTHERRRLRRSRRRRAAHELHRGARAARDRQPHRTRVPGDVGEPSAEHAGRQRRAERPGARRRRRRVLVRGPRQGVGHHRRHRRQPRGRDDDADRASPARAAALLPAARRAARGARSRRARACRGFTGRLNLNRNSGLWRLNAALWTGSPGCESNDLGFHGTGDRAGAHAVVFVQGNKPRRFTRSRQRVGGQVVDLELRARDAVGQRQHAGAQHVPELLVGGRQRRHGPAGARRSAHARRAVRREPCRRFLEPAGQHRLAQVAVGLRQLQQELERRRRLEPQRLAVVQPQAVAAPDGVHRPAVEPTARDRTVRDDRQRRDGDGHLRRPLRLRRAASRRS